MAFGSAYKKASAVCVTVLFAFCAGQPVLAQQNRNNNPTQKELLITEAQRPPSSEAAQLEITAGWGRFST
jgi:hypothetical protein